MFTNKNCLALVVATLLASGGSQAQAGPTGILDKADQTSKLINDGENSARGLSKDASGLFKKTPTDTPATGTAPSDYPANPSDKVTTPTNVPDPGDATTTSTPNSQ